MAKIGSTDNINAGELWSKRNSHLLLVQWKMVLPLWKSRVDCYKTKYNLIKSGNHAPWYLTQMI